VSVDLAIVIFTRDDAEHLRRCLESIEASPPTASYEVIVFDNASQDDTDAVLSSFAERLPLRPLVQASETSFSRGNNIGWESSQAPCVLFLNPDTLVDAAAIDACFDLLMSDPGAGAVSPRLQYPNGDPQPTGWHLPTVGQLVGDVLLRREREVPPHPSGTTDVGWLMGCFVMVRREVLLEIGGWDQGFWVHGTDLEFCAKIRRFGRTVLRLEDFHIVHVGHRGWDAERRRQVRRAHQLWLLRDYGPISAASYGLAAGLWSVFRS
jgi:N-acetylglucosaminyl-diphospho-decaprenol L-rhamnosyltransferase